MYPIKLGLGFIISREVLLPTKVVLSTPTSTRCAVAIDSRLDDPTGSTALKSTSKSLMTHRMVKAALVVH